MIKRIQTNSLHRVGNIHCPKCDTFRKRMMADRLKVRTEFDRLKIAAVAECASFRSTVYFIHIRRRPAISDRNETIAEFHTLQCTAIGKCANSIAIVYSSNYLRQRIRKRQCLKCRTTGKSTSVDRRNPFWKLNLGYAEILKGIHADCRHSCAVDRCRKRQRSGQCRSVCLCDVRERCFARTRSIGPFKTVAVCKLCRPCRSRATDHRADCHNRLERLDSTL